MVIKASSRPYSRREFLICFIVTLLVVICETAVLTLNVDKVRVTSIKDIIYTPLNFVIYMAYVLSVILIPIVSIYVADFMIKLREIYRFYIIKSLELESMEFARKWSKIIPTLIPIAFLLIIVSVLNGIYLLVLLALIPFSIYMVLILKPVYDVYNHSRKIDVELPWFLVLLITLESVRANIKLLIDRLRNVRILPAIAKELIIVDRDSRLYGLSHISSIIGRASTTPNAKLSSVLSGYASHLRSGGDVVSWLKSKLNELLIINEFSLKLYSERMSSVFGQLMIATYAILPLITMTMFVINAYLTVALIISITPLLVILVYISQPRSLNSIHALKLISVPLIVLVSVSVILYRIVGAHSMAIAWILALAVSYRYSEILKEIEILDKDSIEITKTMVELKENGYDVASAFEYIIATGAIHKITKEKLRTALIMLCQGIPLTFVAIRIPSPSFLFRFMLFTLGLTQECGNNDPEVFQTLHEYITKIKALRSGVEKTSRFFDVFAFINVFIVIWIWKSLKPLYESITVWGLPSSISPSFDVLYSILYISLLGYTLVSSTLRRGLPFLELRSILFLLVVLIITPLAML
ncbi:MAG: hypothetical protein QW775_07310 [Ignisphaera sp.]|uniref:Type II secretion system protein GspF domain-containing protein n=1 Tax=Ignisphaera aggregans TaxID=334771 RepID=A0A832CU24_9CREN